MEKTISIRNTEITFSIWDLGGQREFVNMLPLVCNDAVAILFMFDLTRKSTLNSIKEWYRQGRGFNKTAIPFLVGTKYDHFINFPKEDQEEISQQARRFAKAMRASLIFSSTSHSINVQKVGTNLWSLPAAILMSFHRYSRSSSPKLSTWNVPFQRSKTLVNRCCCTRQYRKHEKGNNFTVIHTMWTILMYFYDLICGACGLIIWHKRQNWRGHDCGCGAVTAVQARVH